MAKEAIFSMLESRGGLVGLIVVDLYCGSGSIGIEALSRGAEVCYFIDNDAACLNAAAANFEPLHLEGTAHFIRATLPTWTPPPHIDLLFADPPYGPLDLTTLLRGVRADRVVIENDRLMEAPEGWEVVKTKRYGTTLVTMLEPSEGALS
jgi:16S rRNA (guanine966-N2)-methyltransferase